VAQAECKALIRAVAGRPVTSELIQDTAERIAKVRSSPEGMEGVSAFLEKRRASFLPAEPEPEPDEPEMPVGGA
jgi:methylglutaconyl-CoA hydratase